MTERPKRPEPKAIPDGYAVVIQSHGSTYTAAVYSNDTLVGQTSHADTLWGVRRQANKMIKLHKMGYKFR